MHNPENLNPKPSQEDRQIDFFPVLDNVVPNEDSIEVVLDKFGTKFRFDPKLPRQFEISNSSAQMTAEVSFDANGTITNLSISRWHESDGIEPVYQNRFRQDAEAVLRDYRDELGLSINN